MQIKFIEYFLIMLFVCIVNAYAKMIRQYPAIGGEDVLAVCAVAFIVYDYKKAIKERNR